MEPPDIRPPLESPQRPSLAVLPCCENGMLWTSQPLQLLSGSQCALDVCVCSRSPAFHLPEVTEAAPTWNSEGAQASRLHAMTRYYVPSNLVSTDPMILEDRLEAKVLGIASSALEC